MPKVPEDRRQAIAAGRNRFFVEYTEFVDTLSEKSFDYTTFINDFLTYYDRPITNETFAEVEARLNALGVITDDTVTPEFYTTPAGLGHTVGQLEYRMKSDGTAVLLSDLSDYLPAGAIDPDDPLLVRYYVNPITGNDANTGLSWAQALKHVSVALAKSDVDVVYCEGGVVYQNDGSGITGFPDYTGTRDVAVIAVGEPAIMATARTVTWSVHATFADVYQSSSTGGTVTNIVDTRTKNADGSYLSLTKRNSIQEVHDNAGSWFFQSNIVYIRLFDDAVPNASILVMRAIGQSVQASDVKVYLKNIHFIGGAFAGFAVRLCNAGTIVTVEDCDFTHHHTTDGFQVKDAGLTIAINSRAMRNANDGFNYHEGDTITPDFIEIGCTGQNNMATATGNGSTAHEDVAGMRFNGLYQTNQGPGIADVNDSKTFNAGVTCVNQSGSIQSYGLMTNDSAEVWLDGGYCSGNEDGDVVIRATSTLHYRDTKIGGDGEPINLDGTAIIDSDFS